jgi:hypothetical protein
MLPYASVLYLKARKMAKKKPEQPNGQKLPSKIKFDYIKSNFHRVIHADGAWGGITPRGTIILSFWSERPPIPKQIVHQVTPEGLGEEIKGEREGRDAMIREVEVSVIMDIGAAKAFLAWLQEKVSAAEKIVGQEKHDE